MSAAKRARDAAADGDEARARGDVGRMVDSSQADDRRLIRLVRERRLLYARNNMPVASYYSQVKNLWDDVAAHMAWSVADVRRKWSHIRNSYSRHLRNEMHGACTSKGRMVSRWYLADELEFLREHMATDTRPAPFASFAPALLEMDLKEPEPADARPPPPAAWPPADDDSCGSAAFAADENSSYFQFFRGIHPDYRELPRRKRRAFKRRCLELLHELLDAEEGERALNLSQADERELKPDVRECYILPTRDS